MILLLLGVGYLWLIQVGTGGAGGRAWASRLTALLFGVAAALTLDEFTLWLTFRDVTGSGRTTQHRCGPAVRLAALGRGVGRPFPERSRLALESRPLRAPAVSRGPIHQSSVFANRLYSQAHMYPTTHDITIMSTSVTRDAADG